MLNAILSKLNDLMYTYVLIFLLVGTGLYFTVRTKGAQLRLFKDACKVLFEKESGDGEKKGVSSFQALMISTASRVGTGNIAGIATAIAAGGPGAVFWMWLMALVGGASAFVESTLAQIYKVKDGSGYRGGPAYYMQMALKKRWMGVLFSVLMIICFAYGFNGLQSYNMSSALAYYIPDYSKTICPMLVGLVLAAASAWVIFGGVHRIGFITSVIVPVMAIGYLLLGAVTILMHLPQIPGILAMIVSQAFDAQAIFGGFAGNAVVIGVLDGIPYVQAAVQANVGTWGIHFITISIFAFAFSSLIGNYYYTESNLLFLKNNKVLLFVFRCTCLLAIFLGAQADFEVVWNLADVTMGFMAIVNIAAILLLGNIAIHALEDYEKQKKQGKDPVFHATDIGLDDTEEWK